MVLEAPPVETVGESKVSILGLFHPPPLFSAVMVIKRTSTEQMSSLVRDNTMTTEFRKVAADS